MDTELDTEVLRTELRTAAHDVRPSIGFADSVTRLARRRTLRHRSTMAGACTLTVLLGGAAAALAPFELVPSRVDAGSDVRLQQPTRGDLATDKQFLERATVAWQDGLPQSYNFDLGVFDDRRGEPHVSWAGNTPAGPAAIILQQVFVHEDPSLPQEVWNTSQTAIGLVGTDPVDGKLRLLGDSVPWGGPTSPVGFLFGPGDRTLIALDNGVPAFVSPETVVADDGKSSRTWEQLRFVDGVAVLQLPGGTSASEVRVQLRSAPPDGGAGTEVVPLLRATHYLNSPSEEPPRSEESLLPWSSDDARAMPAGAERPVPADIMMEFHKALENAGVTDPLTNMQAMTTWHVLAGLPDGRTAIVGQRQEDERPSRLFAVLKAADGSVQAVLPGGDVDPKAALPVKIHMPDEQGWVVAAYGAALRYRTTPGGPWTDAGRNAALLPDAAIEVEVTRDGQPPVAVRLGG
jgi:hypothetical protein